MPSTPITIAAAFVLAFAAWIVWRLFSALRTGRATPLRGVWDGFDRKTQPGLFWATVTGNAVVLVVVVIFLVDLVTDKR